VNAAVAERLRASAATAAAALAAIVGGTLAAASPKLAFGVLASALVVVLALRAPVAHLLLLVAIAVTLPPEILNQLSVGGGVGAAGMRPTDVLIVTGCLRVVLELGDVRLDRRRFSVAAMVAAFLAIATVQLLHGLRGYWTPDVVAEFRVLFGVAALFLALPISARDDQLRRLGRGLVVIGIGLGLWGIAQWVLHLQFENAAAAIQGSGFATAGRVAGLYGFPVAIVLSSAALLSGHVRRWPARVALALVVALNAAALMFTFERSFWLAIGAGLIFLLLRIGWGQRIRLLLGVPALALLLVAAMSVLAPSELHAARERVLSLSRYRVDPSFTYRQVENQRVKQHIRAQPINGSGLGASQLIGRPGTRAPVVRRRYAESGYLWLAWKLGIPAAALLCAAMLYSILCRQGPPESLGRSLRIGSQASLVTLAASSVAFAPFNSIAGTTMIGVLMAVAIGPSSVQLRSGGRRT
jgi:O-antigen ligase